MSNPRQSTGNPQLSQVSLSVHDHKISPDPEEERREGGGEREREREAGERVRWRGEGGRGEEMKRRVCLLAQGDGNQTESDERDPAPDNDVQREHLFRNICISLSPCSAVLLRWLADHLLDYLPRQGTGTDYSQINEEEMFIWRRHVCLCVGGDKDKMPAS